ncbi:MAG: glycosyl hydrolase 115 family protein [Lachnospiraceae bacterium]|nr:glycosyl hydrolase 115 family protein [Lachnospiraceae bacterium]
MREFKLSSDCETAFVYEGECSSGILKIAGKVAEDLCLVFGRKPAKLEAAGGEYPDFNGIKIVFGTAGQSPVLDRLSAEGKIDLSAVTGKREVYCFYALSDELLVIAGSDKRGTIYGLFRISEELGVSPFVNWSGLKPARRESAVLDPSVFTASKEPSVEYRGFFINDEWPAFGTWCSKHFGGFTAEMYEYVFELLLRLKGNYLWPAMWTSSFAEDGPGLKSAELADELGVVMGLSHHEPCLRHGEEYSHVRGKDSIYGDAWDFRSNKEGITRFWRDGLKRNGHLENVITVGMRGERDSTILGKEATLKDNIDLLRDVLRTQEQLIREEVNEDLTKVPRMLALYKEVEAYYYGDENTPGLIEGCPELEDVILLLCEDNHGYLRSVPDEKMRKHPGGFGMYYHFDYHGDPVSFEWIDSTYLPEVWQQMGTAYEYGIQKLWIVNVGDLGLQEMPLSYFLDLAYDFDRWGRSGPDSGKTYMHEWMKKQFGHAFDEDTVSEVAELQLEGSRLIHNRRPEHMSAEIYRPQSDYEARLMIEKTESITERYLAIEEKCPEEYKDALYELIGYSLLGGMNLIRMWVFTGLNHYYASIGAVIANDYADKVRDTLKKDAELKDKLQTISGGKFDGFAEAPHIGFTNWNKEESKKPVLHQVIPVEEESVVVSLAGDTGETRGLDWTRRPLTVKTYLEEDEHKAKAVFNVALCGDRKAEYEINTECEWISCDAMKGEVDPDTPFKEIIITVDKDKAAGETGILRFTSGEGRVEIRVKAPAVSSREGTLFAENNGLVVIDADHFSSMKDGKDTKLQVFKDLGRRESAIGLYPFLAHAEKPEDAAYADYEFLVGEEGEYELCFQLLPTNSYYYGKIWKLIYSIDGKPAESLQPIPADHLPGASADWADGVMRHARYVKGSCILDAGKHTLRFYGTDAENVLERVMLVRKGVTAPQSYLGPAESRKVLS